MLRILLILTFSILKHRESESESENGVLYKLCMKKKASLDLSCHES